MHRSSSRTGEIEPNIYTSLSYLFSLNKLCDYKFEEIANYTVASDSSNYDIGMVKPDLQLFTCNGFKFENRHSIAIAQWEVKGLWYLTNKHKMKPFTRKLY